MFTVGFECLSVGPYKAELRLWTGVVREHLVGLAAQQAQQRKLVWWDGAVQLQKDKQ